jgi:hypothetical protein
MWAGIMDEHGMHHVGNFTEAATQQAISAGCTECPMCGDQFDDDGADRHEFAVKMICGHFIGKECLQAWADQFIQDGYSDETNCPCCRHALLAGQFLASLQNPLLEFVAFLRSDPAPDEQVNEVLLNSTEEAWECCYGPEFGDMLAKLDERRQKGARLFTHVLSLVEACAEGEL